MVAAKDFSAAPLLRELAGLDLEHVANGGLFHEIFRRRADAKGRVYSGLLSDGLCDRRRCQENECKARSKVFHFGVLPFCSRLTPAALVSISNNAYRFLCRFDPNGPARKR
jgi:hypothetical protein